MVSGAGQAFSYPCTLAPASLPGTSLLSFTLLVRFFLQDPTRVSSPSGLLPCSTKLRNAPAELLPGAHLLRGPQSSLKLTDLKEILFSRTPLRQSPGRCPLISSWGYGCWWGARPSKRKKESGRVCYLLGFCFER